ncbi:hypothetical protein ACIRU3_38885 [Streptomyces sp. NPDC101151]|uniref:hypothetical protein n=1 Tax=Streptomyces sp. NPDC101151 TaxID=3366115 RepID=UPI00381C0583
MDGRIEHAEGVEPRFPGIDPFQDRLDGLYRRELTLSVSGNQVDGGQIGEMGHGDEPLSQQGHSGIRSLWGQAALGVLVGPAPALRGASSYNRRSARTPGTPTGSASVSVSVDQ